MAYSGPRKPLSGVLGPKYHIRAPGNRLMSRSGNRIIELRGMPGAELGIGENCDKIKNPQQANAPTILSFARSKEKPTTNAPLNITGSKGGRKARTPVKKANAKKAKVPFSHFFGKPPKMQKRKSRNFAFLHFTFFWRSGPTPIVSNNVTAAYFRLL